VTPSPPTALVLLATFNGERYLEAQIASILGQRDSDVRILVRDDRSLDATPALLDRLARQNANIRILHDEQPRLGYARNFSALMTAALKTEASCVILADQDDVWDEWRAQHQILHLRSLEAAAPSRTPCLSYCGYALIDSSGHPLAPRRRLATAVAPATLQTLLAGNTIPGCTMAMNRSLLEVATPVPDCIRNHDHWIALCAAAYGRIGRIAADLLQYRQHSDNAIGSSGILSSLLHDPRAALAKLLRHRDDMRRLRDVLHTLRSRGTSTLRSDLAALLQKAEDICASKRRIARYLALRKLGIAPRDCRYHLFWLGKNLLG